MKKVNALILTLILVVIFLQVDQTVYAAGPTDPISEENLSVESTDDGNDDIMVMASKSIRDVIQADDELRFDDTVYNLIYIHCASKPSETLKQESFYTQELEDRISDHRFEYKILIDGENPTGDYYTIYPDGRISKDPIEKIWVVNAEYQGKYYGWVYLEGDEILAIPVKKGAMYDISPRSSHPSADDPTQKNGWPYGISAGLPGDVDNISPTSSNPADINGYKGSANQEDLELNFAYEWNAYYFLEIETEITNPDDKIIDLGGYSMMPDSTVVYYIEVKNDRTGAITPLPQEWYFNIGCSDHDYVKLSDGDGLVYAQCGRNTRDYDYCTGELEVRIPYGYSYRIHVYDCDEDYGYDGFRAAQGVVDEDGFSKPLAGEGLDYQEVTFFPLTQQIRVEKEVTGEVMEDTFDFQLTRDVAFVQNVLYTFKDGRWGYWGTIGEYTLPQVHYRYRLYDSFTDEEIEPEIDHRTTMDGHFTLKTGQYAIFKTYMVPEDYAEYGADYSYFAVFYDGIPEKLRHRDEYTFEETTEGLFYTEIEHRTTEGSTMILGQKVECVHGQDGLYYHNFYSNNGLTVMKTVAGNAGDKTKEFEFTVVLSDTDINGIYGDMTFADGVAKFTLKNDESKTAENLPNGTTYIVSEADYSADGYVTTKSGDTGTIAGGNTVTASFTNTKDSTIPPSTVPEPENGNLMVRKTVSGNDADGAKAFSFTVTLDDATINGTYGDMNFANGVATFLLKGGESTTATGLPAGMGYIVSEADYSADGYVTAKSGDTGIIVAHETEIAAFTNTKDKAAPVVKSGNLTIYKTVKGDLGDKTKDFSFTVTFDAEGSYRYTGSKSGTISSGGMVQLKHGEYIEILGLPEGTQYSVTESDNTGYQVYMSGETGVIMGDRSSNAQFTNTKSKVPITGDNSSPGLYLGIMVISLLGMICTVLYCRKMRKGAAFLKRR